MASKGDKFRSEAESTVQSTQFSLSSIFGFGKAQKLEEAAELYIKAGNAYKIENRWDSAGDMFMKASKCHQDADSSIDSVNDLVNAGNCYKKTNQAQAIKVFISVIDSYNENGNFGRSAKYHEEIAEMYEATGNIESTIQHYNNAAELFNNENKPLAAQPCYLKIAGLYAKQGNFIQAAELFEKIGRDSLNSRLGAFSAKGYFFQSLMCYLAAGDNVGTKNKVDAFKSADVNFPISRECSFIEKLLQAVENNDSEAFSQACFDFDHITPLDAWKTEMLLHAKKHILSDDDVDIS